MSLNPIVISGTNLPDIFHQTLYKAVEIGKNFKINEGSFVGTKRREFDFVTIHAKCPGMGELIPKLNPALNIDDPVATDYVDGYAPYIMTAEENPNESYTYGQLICGATLDEIDLDVREEIIQPHWDEIIEYGNGIIQFEPMTKVYTINQMELMIWMYKHKGHRNNQMIMQVGSPTDMKLKDPPCLRHIDTRVQDGKLHFFPYFRSWDLWGGLPANLAVIEMARQYCSDAIGLDNPKQGEIIATSKGLHLYDYIWEIAELVRGRTMDEFAEEFSDGSV